MQAWEVSPPILPGWSFHGGQGFSVNLPSLGPVDIAGLFVIETSPTELLKTFVKRAIEGYIDNFFAIARQKILFFPQPPTLGRIQAAVLARFVDPSIAMINRYFRAANTVWKAGDAVLRLIENKFGEGA